jgi:hypothetical protein
MSLTRSLIVTVFKLEQLRGPETKQNAAAQ